MTDSLSSPEPAAAGCGCGAAVKFDGATPAYRRILMAVIAINGAAFLAIAGGAALQGSASLGANALDFLADAATYGISLAVIGRSVAVRSGAAIIKGASLAALALFILGYAIWRATSGRPRKASSSPAWAPWAFSPTPWPRCCWSAIAKATPMSVRSGCARATT